MTEEKTAEQFFIEGCIVNERKVIAVLKQIIVPARYKKEHKAAIKEKEAELEKKIAEAKEVFPSLIC